MRDIYSDTRDEPRRQREERPFLYAPAPLEYTPWDERREREPEEDEDAPRVVIIDI